MSPTYDLIIKGGIVVLPDGCQETDIAVKDGVIAAIGRFTDSEAEAERIHDAAGLTVLPGAVDIHVHFNEPGLGSWEGFASGSASLAAGGVTTYVDMPLNGVPPTVSAEAFALKLDRAEGASYVDYALWGGLVPGNQDELAGLADRGAVGFKAFMSEPGGEGEDIFARADDVTLLEGMREIARLGGLLALHAESEAITKELAARLQAEGSTDMQAYLASRPVIAEAEAVNRALLYARHTGCALHFVHISSVQALELIDAAKAEGLNVTAETCPHYLCLTDEDAVRIGAVAKCAPPLRDQANRELMWEAFRSGSIDVIASDHSPCPPEMKLSENYFEIWGGISGAQSTLPIMIEEGHIKRGIALERIAEATAFAPARRTGLAYRKGSIEVGKDADFALVDFSNSFVLQPADLLYRHKQSPYSGYAFSHSIAATFCRGYQVYERGTGVIDGRRGSYIPGKKSSVGVRGTAYAR
ncbi:allantoinase AllB [Paenibacillus sp. P96]|uniref:Allantoinase n=1 Tax=Paenibacillus zeirhizosphaerae TaxID=2987519 RepID=A0ABT9FVH3_9BACL|nr:allantoinase AllB [Paenibacillus sp. P96]MDP4098719.1 allantoinase AllB [Paenibacillus sp. P96]